MIRYVYSFYSRHDKTLEAVRRSTHSMSRKVMTRGRNEIRKTTWLVITSLSMKNILHKSSAKLSRLNLKNEINKSFNKLPYFFIPKPSKTGSLWPQWLKKLLKDMCREEMLKTVVNIHRWLFWHLLTGNTKLFTLPIKCEWSNLGPTDFTTESFAGKNQYKVRPCHASGNCSWCLTFKSWMMCCIHVTQHEYGKSMKF